MLVPGVFVALAIASVSSNSTQDIEAVQDPDINAIWDLVKDFFKIHLYVNPHPACALEDEKCTMDDNCCKGLECKVSVDHSGVEYTCQPETRAASELSMPGDETDPDVFWKFVPMDSESSSDESYDVVKESIRRRLEDARDQEERLMKDQYYIAKELRKPLSVEEMRTLLMEKRLEDLKRERELKELREWASSREQEQAEEDVKRKEMERIAKERVRKVLEEEERQKLEYLKNIQEMTKNSG